MFSTIKKIFSDYKEFLGNKSIFIIVFIGTLYSFLAALEPLFFGKIIEELEGFYATSDFDDQKILWITAAWGVFILVTILLKYIYFQHFISMPVLKFYKNRTDSYAKKVIHMSYGAFLSKKIEKSSLRQHIGIVSQDNTLFNMSIKENLLLIAPKASQKDLEKALAKAEARFVFDLPKGINTVIGERGLKLSGGEKQRISIARLFLSNPEILILDEATSALDNKTEKLIQKALDTLTRGKTSIVIAHRLSTIQNADKIFMVEKGTIVESGSYDELIKKKGKFYRLANPEHFVVV